MHYSNCNLPQLFIYERSYLMFLMYIRCAVTVQCALPFLWRWPESQLVWSPKVNKVLIWSAVISLGLRASLLFAQFVLEYEDSVLLGWFTVCVQTSYTRYLCLQDGSTLLLGSERLFEHLDMLLAVWVLVVEGLEFCLQSQQLRLLLWQLLLQLVNLQTWNRQLL